MDLVPLYLSGKFIFTGEQSDVINPYTNQVFAHYSVAGSEETDQAVQSAAEALPKLALLSSHDRYGKLMDTSRRLAMQRERFAQIISNESGKPLRYAYAEVDRALQTFLVAAEESKRQPREFISLDWTEAGRNREGLIRYFPVGIVAGITPFNFPLNLAVHKIAPALAAGCPIIIKPASKTPLSCLYLAQILHEAEWPAGTISILPMDRTQGDQLIKHPGISVLSFTGSPEVGWKMKDQSGKKKTILELGGNAGVIVSEHGNINAAIDRCLIGGYAYSGQVCIHAQRIFIQENIFQSFSDEFSRRVSQLKYGSPSDADTDISNMIDEANAIRVESWVAESISGGAKVLHGGKRKINYFEPTILTSTNAQMKVRAEEIFGPVVTLEPYHTFEEAVAMINDTRFGLQAGVFTDSIEEMDQAFQTLQVGGVILNDVPTLRFDHMPYGGVRDSGMGREGVRYAMQDLMECRILVK